jgi:amidase
MTSQDLAELSIPDAGVLLRAGAVTSVALTEAMIGRIAARDDELHSFVSVRPEAALSQAAAVDAELARGLDRGPLHGIPVAVKDIADTAGWATAAGMPLLADRVPTDDATTVTRLHEGGSVLLGKVKTTEGVFVEHRDPFAAPANPWDPDRWTGVSSSGSAVSVAAGLCFAALASDTGGSIRIPAACTGVTGIKPTWGRVSRHGIFELAGSLDHVGTMGRSAVDAAAMLQVIGGFDPADPTSASVPMPDLLADDGRGLSGLRVGLDEAWAFVDVDDHVLGAVQEVIAVLCELGMRVVPVSMPSTRQVVADWTPLCAVEAARVHAPWYPSRRDEYGEPLRELLDRAAAVGDAEYERILRRRADFTAELRQVVAEVDVMISPAMGVQVPLTAEFLDEDDSLAWALQRFACPFSSSGSPTITFPVGRGEAGLPIAAQLVASDFQEATLVRVVRELQRSTDWHALRPPAYQPST